MTLDGRVVDLAGADAHNMLDGCHEDLAVADLARARRLHDRLDGGLDMVVRYDNFNLHLGQEVDDILGAPVELGMAFLPAKALHLGYCQTSHAYLGKRFAHFV